MTDIEDFLKDVNYYLRFNHIHCPQQLYANRNLNLQILTEWKNKSTICYYLSIFFKRTMKLDCLVKPGNDKLDLV